MTTLRCARCGTSFQRSLFSARPIRCPACGVDVQTAIRDDEVRGLRREFADRDEVISLTTDSGDEPQVSPTG